ncbi:MAG: PAS domain S-box protein, partial [Dehalococcoidia bacterium]
MRTNEILQPARMDAVRDPERLAALRATGLLDSQAEETFDRLTRLAAQILHAPMALISLVDEERQFFTSCIGLPEPWATSRQTPLSHSFCQYVVATGRPVLIEDAREQPLLRDNRAVPDLAFVAYAGVPITTADGSVLGSFAVIDHEPRLWTAEERAILTNLGAVATDAIATRSEARQREAQAEARRELSAADRTVAALQESEERYRRIVETAQEGIWTIDAEGKTTFANQRLAEMLGYSVDEMLGAPLLTFFAEEANQDALRTMRHRRRAGIGEAFEFRYRRKDGSELPVSLSVSSFFDGDGNYQGALALVTDISQRKQDEAALRASEKFLPSALDALSAEIAILDDKGTIIAVNEAWRRFGQANSLQMDAFAVGSNYLAVCEAADGAFREEAMPAAAAIRAVIAGAREATYLEYPCDSPTQQRWFGLRVTPLAEERGIQVVVAHEDISERKAAEQALAEREATLSAVLATSPDAIAILEAGTGVVRYASPATVEIIGYAPEELIGKTLTWLIYPDDQEIGGQFLRQTRNSGAAPPARIRFQHRDEQVVWLEARARRMEPVSTERPGAIVTVAHDATAQVQMEADLRQAKQEAERASQAKSEFLSRVSHELRTPMNAILGFGQLLEMEPLEPEEREEVEQILAAARHLLNLINDVLEIARIESGRLALSLEAVPLETVVAECIPFVRSLAAARHIQFSVDQPSLGSLHVQADNQRLQQVLLNLLSHAVK